ncbi:hypothetical protein VTL71DRAFT_8839 [Oculimacula yallundae]|uniref:Uncharacterized protein n=1 Tax=Oculimacula yallundae TaxID=86028 RepID=A0ABR4BT04_9HELO
MSLLKQLTQERPLLPNDVKSFYNSHRTGRTRPSINDISRTLQSIASLYTRVFIIVDALDKCQLTGGYRAKFLSEIFSLQAECGINLFITSRFIPEIIERFQRSLLLEIRANEQDVRRYVDGHISHLPSFAKRSPDLQEEVKTGIVKAVDGMFLLAQLHLESLFGKRFVKAFRAALTRLPTGSKAYDRAYNNAMERIEGQVADQEELAKQVLSWVTCAKRQLTTSELQHALAVEVGEPELDKDNLPQIDDMVSMCAGLVTVDKESGVIRLVHYTTQDFFTRTWKQWFPNAETDITMICSTYLSFKVFQNGPCKTDKEFEERLRSNQLYSYAARSWGLRAQQVRTPYQKVINFLKSSVKVGASSQALFVNKRVVIAGEGYNAGFPRHMTGLHLAAYFGVDYAAQLLLDNIGPNMKDGYGRIPLFYAAEKGHSAFIQILLEARADTALKDRDHRMPLSYSASNGHEDAMKLLLEKSSVDIDSRDIQGRTPLAWAAMNGHEAIVKLLLETGKTDIDSKDEDRQTPLAWAAMNGHETVMELLLATKEVDADSITTNHYRAMDCIGGVASFRTPLSWAAEKGHEIIVKLLLETGRVDVDSKDEYGQTPLSWAAEEGHKGVVKLLLETGKVDADSKSTGRFGAGQTPLLFAARNGHEAVVQQLLQTGKVDVDSKNTGEYFPGRTPLSWAAENGEEAVVKLLLEKGHANVNSMLTGKYVPDFAPILWLGDGHGKVVASETIGEYFVGRTPLAWAAENGHEAIVQLLLDKGANADLKDENGWTPLSWATRNGHEAVIKLLLATPGIFP